MIRINEIALSLDEDESQLKKKALQVCHRTYPQH